MRLRDNIIWSWSLSRGFRLRLLLDIVLGIASVALSLLFIYLSKSLIDRAVSGEMSGGILRPALEICAVLLTQLLCVTIRGRMESIATVKMQNGLRERLFYRVMLSRWSGKELFHTGDITTRLDGDVRGVCEMICEIAPAVVVIAFEFLLSFIFMLSLDSRLAWVLLLVMPISLILSKRYMLRMRRLTHSIRGVESSLQSHIQEQVQRRSIISSMAHTLSSLSSLERLGSEFMRESIKRTDYTLFSRSVIRIGFAAGYLITLFWCIGGLGSGVISFGVMTAFLQLVSKIQAPIVGISSQLSTIAQRTSSIDRLSEIDNLEIEEQGESIILSEGVGVNFNGVDFGYDHRNIFTNFNHDFSPNELHVVMGESGSGKSTLVRLMLGFLAPKGGEIEVYNNSQRVRCSPLTRDNFVYVPQGNSLISGSIRDNILLGDPSADDKDIAKVIHTAAADFIHTLPQGLDTICGEGGAGVSEGEAQRIAIARALLRKGCIILLDEPTSALDSATESLLIERLTTHAQGRTLIMVTHKQSTSEMCKNIVELKKNTIFVP